MRFRNADISGGDLSFEGAVLAGGSVTFDGFRYRSGEIDEGPFAGQIQRTPTR